MFPRRSLLFLTVVLFVAGLTSQRTGRAAPSVSALTPISISSSTGEKPQSKVWFYASNWWAVMPTTASSPGAGTWVWRLEANGTWTPVTQLSARTDTHADVKPLSSGVAHVLLYGSSPELVSIEYVPASRAWQPWTSRPAASPVALPGSETATIDIDSTGRMWLATETVTEIQVYYADAPYAVWQGPVSVASGINTDDIGVVVAMPGSKIGVLWSNQNTHRFGFKVHVDGADPTIWSADEVPASQSALDVGAGMADDHLNVKVAADGTLYAAVKTSYDTAGYPKIALLVRRPSGTWDDLYPVDQSGTRAIVLLDEVHGLVRVVYTSAEGYNDIIYKESSLSTIDFSAPAQTLISGGVNDATSTKQNWSGRVVVLASTATTAPGVLITRDDPALVGYWRMDETGGATAFDASGFGDDGALQGNATRGPGVTGQALVLDGAGDYARVANASHLNISGPITVATWLKPGQYATQDVVKKAINGTVDGFELSLATTKADATSRKVFFRINQVASGDTFRANSATEYPIDGTWIHAAATYDGASIRLYINGVLESTVSGPAAIATNTQDLTIGAQSDGTRGLLGAVDDVRVYNRALNDAEIAALAGVTPQQADLSITKTDGLDTITAGSPITYTIVVSNAGPNAVAGATVTDSLPAALLGATWICSATPGSTCSAGGTGSISDTVTIAVNGAVTYSVTATVSAAATGTLTNTASVGLPGGITDPVPGNNSSTDVDTVTPPGVNQPPVVNAGPDQKVSLASGAALAGTATDDGLPGGVLTTTWSQVSGPGVVTFGDPAALTTTATFPVHGTYVLRLTASDGALSTSDDLIVTVVAPLNSGLVGYWRMEEGGGTTLVDSSDAGNNAAITGSPTWTAGKIGLGLNLDGSTQNAIASNSASLNITGSMTLAAWVKPGRVATQNIFKKATGTTAPTGGYELSLSSPGKPFVRLTDGTTLYRVDATSSYPINGTWMHVAATYDGAKVRIFINGIQEGTDLAGPTSLRSNTTPLGIGAEPATTVINRLQGQLDEARIYNRALTAAEISALVANTAPIVDAGVDQIVTLPDTASLAGSVTDTTLPAPPGALTATWTEVSGPGIVTFANQWSASTTVTFPAAGTYVLRLTGDDGMLTASDDVTITVNTSVPVNQPPVVNAGPDQTVRLSTLAVLSGAASDDGLPSGTLTTSWSQISGPATVIFANPNALVTTATFSMTGTYELQLTASDGALSASDTVTVTVKGDLVGYWPFEEGSGSQVLDASEWTNNGTLYGAPSWSPGMAGQALRLNGTSQYALVPHNASLDITGAMTAMAWIRPERCATQDVIKKAVNGSVNGFELSLATTTSTWPCKVFFRLNQVANGDTYRVNSPTVYPIDGSWMHVAATYDGTSMRLYINGVLENTVAGPASIATNLQSLGIGAQSNGDASRLFQGTIDEARVYARALSDGEIKAFANRVPIVSAGPDQAITLPEAASLAGTVTDDGLPSGVVTIGWTQVSGPGTVEFANPNAAATTATFPIDGTYVLRLTGDDGMLTASDELTITVSPAGPANQAPTVDAGADQFVTLPAGAALAGTVTDDGLPNPPGAVTTTWSMASGPGTVTFANPSSTTTTATFSAPGTYVLQLMANDSALSASDTLTVVVNVAPGNYALAFNGTNQYVTFGPALDLGSTSFTIETWFRRTGPGATASTGTGGVTAVPLVTKGRGEADGSNVDMNYFLGIEATTNLLVADFEEGAAPSPSPGLNHPVKGTTPIAADGQWHHAAAAYDATSATWHLYLDGRLEATATLPAGTVPRADSLQHAGLATAMTSTGAPAGYFAGELDEVRIWGFARSQADIRSTLYNEVATGAGLLGRWGLNEGAGSVAADSATNPTAENGTLMNAPVWVAAAANYPPAVDAGTDQTVPAGAQIVLEGSAIDDGRPLPATLTLAWSKVSGPGTVTFGSPSAATTTATFSTPGSYALRLTAMDGALSASDDVLVSESVVGAAAIDFGGTNAYVALGNPAKLGLQTFTLESWFRLDGAGVTTGSGSGGITAVPLITKGRAEADGSNVDMNYFLGITAAGVLGADFEDMASGLNHPVTGSTAITAGTWHHAAATFDGTTWKLYLDGALDGSAPAGAIPRYDSIQPAAIGSALNSTGVAAGFFDGAIDEARIWNRALSPGEILANRDLEMTSGDGLVARWGFNEGVGTTAADSIAPGATGTIVGAAYAWVSGAPFELNDPPAAPVLVSPADGATDVPAPVTLSVRVDDPDSTNLTVKFYGRPKGTTPPGPDFTIIALPDTQNYTASLSGGTPAMFVSQTTWIAANAVAENIAYVAHVGDVTNDNTTTQWDNANTSMTMLETGSSEYPAGVPYGVSVGNHDGSPTNTAPFNQYFGSSRFAGRPYYGGHYGSDNDNHYDLFSASGMDFIVIHLEYPAAAELLDWADALLKSNAARRGIIVSHSLIGTGDPGAFSAEGQAIYDALKDNPNLFLMLCGHAPGEGRRTDTNGGNTIHTLLADYQNVAGGGNGWLRVMEFSPANNEIRVKTYSPYLNQWDTDSTSQFALSYPMSSSTPFTLIGEMTAASGTTASIAWTGLANSTGYEWYVTVADQAKTVTGPTWSFTTAAPANRLPVAVDDVASTPEDTAVTVNVLANDSDPDGGTLTITDVSQPANGATTIIDGQVAYTPAADFNGSDSFTYTVGDGQGGSATATVTVTVTPVNDAPVAQNGTLTTSEDTAATGTLVATDADHDALTYVVAGQAAHGTAVITDASTGAYSYTPAADYTGSDSFTFKVNDGTVDSAIATITITVTAVNDAPVAHDDVVVTAEDTAVSPNVLANDSDPDGDPLTVTAVTQGSHGSVALVDGVVTYTPAADFDGTDSFTYTIGDGQGGSATATVTVTVTPVNDAPVAQNGTLTTSEDTAATGTLVASDADHDALTYVVVGQAAHGTAVITNASTGAYSYTPAADYNGSDSFTFKVNDGTVDSAIATVTITITAVNDAPVVSNPGAQASAEGSSVSLNVSATDADHDTLTFGATGLPANLTINATTGVITGTLDYASAGSYQVTVTATDPSNAIGTAAFTWTITNVNRAPIANAQSVTTNEDTAVGITLTGGDPDGDALTYAIVTGPAHGVLSGTAPNLTYMPAANFNGSDSFTFKVNDGTVDSAVATATVTIIAVNDAPVVSNPGAQASAEGSSVSLNVSATDADHDTLTFSAAGLPANLTINPTTGAITGTLDYTSAGSYQVTVTATDPSDAIGTAAFTWTITNVNRAPIANAQSVATNEDTAVGITLAGGDPDGDALTYAIVTGPAHGVLSGTPPNLTYTPAPNYFGSDSFTFKVNDGLVDSNTATVGITLTAVNDPPVAGSDAYEVEQDTQLTVAAPGVLANDTDVDSTALTAVLATGPAHGTLVLNANGSFTYTPAAGYFGTDTFIYVTSDGIATSAPATVTITIDPLPAISITDVTVIEGNSGKANATFTITLSRAVAQAVTVKYATGNDGSPIATPGVDYLSESGSLKFGPGQTKKTVTVKVVGDKVPEPTEYFALFLSNPTNATLAKDRGVCTIVDNDQ